MPQIPEYRLRNEIQGPVTGRRAYAEDAGVVGASLEKFGDAAQNVQQTIKKNQEISDVASLNKKVAKAHADAAVEWQDTISKADPNDKEVAARFNESLKDKLNAIGDTVETDAGRRFFEEQQASLQGHFQERTFAGQAQLAGEAAKQDFVQAVGASSAAVRTDISSYDSTLQRTLDDLDFKVKNGVITALHAQELQRAAVKSLTQARIQGEIDLDPEGVKKNLKEGLYDDRIDNELKKQMFQEADHAITAKEVEKNRLEKLNKEELETAQKQTQNDFLEKLSKNQLSTKDVLNSNLSPFGSGSKEAFLQLMKAKNEAPAKTDPYTFNKVFSQIHLPDGDPKKIVDENDINKYVSQGKLTLEDAIKLRKEVQGKGTEEGSAAAMMKKNLFETARATFIKNNLIADPQGQETLSAFTAYALKEYDAQKKQGKTDMQLLDPQSPDYIGKGMSLFKRTPQQIMESRMKNFSNVQSRDPNVPAPKPVSPRKEGESPAAYIERMKQEQGKK